MALTLKTLQSQIDELREIVERLQKEKTEPSKIKIKEGEFELCGYKWKVINEDDGKVFCICESIGDMKFDSKTNNWSESDLRKYLNKEFKKKIIDEIGEEKIVEFERRLWSVDGSVDYGTCKDYVSLLTSDEYRKYNNEIGTNGDYWWLCNANSKYVAVVCPSGCIYGFISNYVNGVRPVCIFLSSIFESEE